MTSLPYMWYYAHELDNYLPFNYMCDSTKSERYTEAENTFKATHQLKRVVGHSWVAV